MQFVKRIIHVVIILFMLAHIPGIVSLVQPARHVSGRLSLLSKEKFSKIQRTSMNGNSKFLLFMTTQESEKSNLGGKVQSQTIDNSKLKPKDLLAKYGVAYLLTSITLSIFSYGFFYFLVGNGVDVAALLKKVGITSTAAATSTGTAAIAYALHKAASPIRFPPTVLLTPVVAKFLGKKPKETSNDQ